MPMLVRKIFWLLREFGMGDIWRLAHVIRNIPRFATTLHRYQQMSKGSQFPLNATKLYPILYEFDEQAGLLGSRRRGQFA